MDGQQNAENSSVGSSTAPDEARLQEALKQLKVLHIKSRLLRDTIPKMLDPLVQKQPSPEVMFATFLKSVEEAQEKIQELKDVMRDEKSKEVFAMADKSKEENPFGIKPWRHEDHPNWFNMEKDDY